MSFSKRFGHKPIEKEIQLESMDEDLKNSLWNVIHKYFFKKIPFDYVNDSSFFNELLTDLWSNHFKLTIDGFQKTLIGNVITSFKSRYLRSIWNEIYDIVEFLAQKEPQTLSKEEFVNECNVILQREFSAYRFVENKLTSITSKEEVQEIENAIQSRIDAVKDHLTTSLNMLSDKKSPDYRNSIKESISAVEAICKIISGNPNSTMTQALKEIEDTGKIELHSDMKDAFQKLYWYTSDADGIRHSLMDGKVAPDFDDAKFMLVSCSAIVNYLISKANKAGIKLK